MKLIGFQFQNDVTIQIGDVFLDLHNDYDFVGFEQSHAVTLTWHRSREDETLPQSVVLNFDGVSALRFCAAKGPSASGDAQTVAFLGFLDPDQEAVMNGFLDRSNVGPDADFIAGFEDTSALKISAKSIQAQMVGSSLPPHTRVATQFQ